MGLQLSTQWTLRVLPVDHIRMAPESGESPGQIPRLVIQDKFLFNPKIQDRKVTPKTAQQKVELLLDIPNFNDKLKIPVYRLFQPESFLLINSLTFMPKMRLIP